jgi:hypothetical protein
MMCFAAGNKGKDNSQRAFYKDRKKLTVFESQVSVYLDLMHSC